MKKLWIARDKDGSLHLFFSKPERVRTHFGDFYSNKWKIGEWRFPSVTWENSPQQVELKLISNGNDSF